MGNDRDNSNDLPKREAGATLDAPDRAQLIINRESQRAAYEKED
jgi:hypothetical protein